MNSLFATLKKYSGSWELVKSFEISTEDKSVLDPIATVVKSTYGRSFVFTGKGNSYKQYIPINEKSAAQIGQQFALDDIIIQELAKEGETIYRCAIKTDVL